MSLQPPVPIFHTPAATCLYPILFLKLPVFILFYSCSYLSLSYLIPAATCIYLILFLQLPVLFLQLPLFILPCSFLSLSLTCKVPIPFLSYSHLIAAASSPYPCSMHPLSYCYILLSLSSVIHVRNKT